MKRILLFIFLTLPTLLFAEQGMWLPSLIGTRIPDMQQKGFQLTDEDIYSVNEASLKDAVILFGGGCTGEVISDEGLILTNHHCGYYFIGSHSSVEHDYLTHGFWAMNRQEELPNPGLNVKFLVEMRDVTEQVLKGTSPDMDETAFQEIVNLNSEQIRKAAIEGTHYESSVESFYYGNQYFLFIYEVFNDIRLVGAPPSAIGKFGGDTDNWMWPRHTGDFAIFRIYADADNKPAAYSAENVPFRPRKSFTIATGELNEGDFTMVYGFPGRTMQYVISDEIDCTVNVSNPLKIALRTQRLEIMNAEQAKDPAVRIAYAAKNARVSNAWKKWQGESKGLIRLNTLQKKQMLEQEFQAWAGDKPEYQDLLPELKSLYEMLRSYAFARDLYQEAYQAIELTEFAKNAAKNIYAADAASRADGHFKNYYLPIDLKIAKRVMTQYYDELETTPSWMPETFVKAVAEAGSVEAFITMLFAESNFSTKEKYVQLAEMDSLSKVAALTVDPAILMAEAFDTQYRELIEPEYKTLQDEIRALYRPYMRGLMEMSPEKTFFPDANRTLRVAYGNVEGYVPMDAVYYKPFSTLDGVMEKDNPDIYDYDIPQRLRDIYATKDYGQFAITGGNAEFGRESTNGRKSSDRSSGNGINGDSNGANGRNQPTVPVCFIATNHTTGGNSGSPVLNGRGELIGINFDRTWESTMSDYEFDPSKCRNITVDIRYVLFVIDKVGGAGYLFDEMRFSDYDSSSGKRDLRGRRTAIGSEKGHRKTGQR